VPVQPVERKLAAIFAADMVGYSRLMARDEVATLASLKACRAIIDSLIASHHGRIFNTAGDSVVADFASAVDAVQCAVAVQAAIATENAGGAADETMQFRIGVHVGDVMVDGDNLLGDGVNIAARLESLAQPGAICVSAAARDHIGNKLPLAFDDLGDQQVKNIPQAVRVYRVQTEVPAAQPTAAMPLRDRPSLAVLPFQNMSGDPEQEYFADGMVEEITTAISRFPWLSVIARNSAFTYKGRAIDVKQVGRELGVRYVLEGSVRKGGNRVRITAQLIEAATGAHLWADRFDGSLDDIFELQDEVASRVVGVIEPRMRLSETDRVSRKPTENLDAYDLHLRALAQTYKRTKESVAEAIRLARRALELDPAFTPAMARIAGSRQFQRLQHWIPASGAEVDEGIQMARQALAAARDNPEVLRMSGVALAALAGENETALTALDRAIELNPNYAFAYAQRANVLNWLNRPDEAIDAAERAMRLSPNDPNVYEAYLALGVAHLVAGRYEEALSWVDHALGSNAGLPALRLKLSLCGHLGRHAGATECLQRLRETHAEPTVAALMRAGSKGTSPELATRTAEGLRKAGLPEG
jgi:TolB-like protein/Flp pilus assembly protein TadD